MRAAVTNDGAKFSRFGFAALVERSERDSILAEKVGKRPDIPPHLYRNLLLRASDVVQQRLLASSHPESQPEIRRVLAKVSQEMADAASPRDYTDAQRAVAALQAMGKLDEAALYQFAVAGRGEEAIVVLSALSQVPLSVVSRLIGGSRPDAAIILCRALGFGWETASAVLSACQSAAGSPQALAAALAHFERLTPTTARRVMQFWQLREGGLQEAS